MRRYRSGGSVITFARIARIPPSNIWNGSATASTQSSSSRKRLPSCLLRGRFLSTSSVLRRRKACLAGCPMATTSSWATTATTAATAGPGDLSPRETSSARSSTYSNDVHERQAKEYPVKRFFRCLSFALVSLSACTAEGVYEGSRAYDKAVKSTPMEKSKEELPSYDQYEKERRGGGKERRECSSQDPCRSSL